MIKKWITTFIFSLLAYSLVGCKATPSKAQLSIAKTTYGDISYSLGASYNFGEQAIDTTKVIDLEITNTGRLPITNIEYILQEDSLLKYRGEDFPGTGGSCLYDLKTNSTCKLSFYLYSAEKKQIHEVLKLRFNNGVDKEKSESIFTVSGLYGEPAQIVFEKNSFDFGIIEPTVADKQIIKITNIGELAAKNLEGISITTVSDLPGEVFKYTGGKFPGLAGTCTKTLTKDQTCSIEYYAIPPTDNQEYEGELNVSYKTPSKVSTARLPLKAYGAEFKAYLIYSIKEQAVNDKYLFEETINNIAAPNAPTLTFILENDGYAPAKDFELNSSGNLNVELVSSTCPVQIPSKQTCEQVYRFIPRELNQTQKIEYKEQKFNFKYHDNKYPQFKYTNDMFITGIIKQEANLLLLPNNNPAQEFDPNISLINKQFTWPIGEFEMIIGKPVITRSLIMKNGRSLHNGKMSDIRYEFIPNDGFLQLSCFTTNSCATKMNDGQTFNLVFTYNPLSSEDKRAAPYKFKITYFDGVKDKSISVDIQARARAIPIMAISETSLSYTALHNETKTASFNISNTGISGITPTVANNYIKQEATDSQFYTIDDSDCNRSIKAGTDSSCRVDVHFRENGDRLLRPFVNTPRNNKIVINNGLDVADPKYESYTVDLTASLYERGYYTDPDGSNITRNFDFGEISFDNSNVPGGEDKTKIDIFSLMDSHRKGTEIIEHFNIEIVGEEADQFSISYPSVAQGTPLLNQTVFMPGNFDGPKTFSDGTDKPNLRNLRLHYNSPLESADLGVDGIASAQVIIKYHGRKQSSGSLDYEPEVITLNLKASPKMLPLYKLSKANLANSPFNPTLKNELATIAPSNQNKFKIRNVGQLTENVGELIYLETTQTNYKIKASNTADTCFESYNQISDQRIEYKIKALAECEFEIYDYSPTQYSSLLNLPNLAADPPEHFEVLHYGPLPNQIDLQFPVETQNMTPSVEFDGLVYYGKYQIDVSTLENEPFEPSLQGVQSNLKAAAKNKFKIKNIGLIDSDNLSTTLKTVRSSFKIKPVDITDSCFIQVAQISDQQINFKINVEQECEFEIYDYTPDNFGNIPELISLSPTIDGLPSLELLLRQMVTAGKANQIKFNGKGFKLANLTFDPIRSGTLDFINFGDILYNSSIEKETSIASDEDSAFVVPGEVLSVEKIALPTDHPECTVAYTKPPTWSGFPTVYRPNSFSLTQNNCNAQSIYKNGTYFTVNPSCSLKFRYTANHIGKAETACFKVRYKKRPDSSTLIGEKVVIVAGSGLIPKSNFMGWRGIYSEGETPQTTARTKIQWKPMTVENGLGNVKGYRVFRKLKNDAQFPIAPTQILDLTSYNPQCDCYTYTDIKHESAPVDPSYIELIPNSLYEYKVQAQINVPGEGDFDSPTISGSADEKVAVLLPTSFQSLVHRWTANINTCLIDLKKSYTDLDRISNYTCQYTGDLNVSGGKYDYRRSVLIDRYESGKDPDNNGKNVPGLLPKLYEDLVNAKKYCSDRKQTIAQLKVYGAKLRLLNKQDYMIASTGIDKETCISAEAVSSSAESDDDEKNRCSSIYGVEDLIGNAWDILDHKIKANSQQKWIFDQNDSLFAGEQLRYTVDDIDLENLDTTTYDSYVNFFKIDGAIPCLNPHLNLRKIQSGGVCLNTRGEYLISDLASNLLSDLDPNKKYSAFSKHESQLDAAFEPVRHLMVGGSFSSNDRFNIPPHRRAEYWTNPKVESIFMTQHPKGAYEGGAARCALDINLN